MYVINMVHNIQKAGVGLLGNSTSEYSYFVQRKKPQDIDGTEYTLPGNPWQIHSGWKAEWEDHIFVQWVLGVILGHSQEPLLHQGNLEESHKTGKNTEDSFCSIAQDFIPKSKFLHFAQKGSQAKGQTQSYLNTFIHIQAFVLLTCVNTLVQKKHVGWNSHSKQKRKAVYIQKNLSLRFYMPTASPAFQQRKDPQTRVKKGKALFTNC